MPLWLLFKPKYVGKGREKDKIKIIFLFRSKNRKKIQKIEKYHYSFISSQNRLDMAEKERK